MKINSAVKSTKIMLCIWFFCLMGLIGFSKMAKISFWGSLWWNNIMDEYETSNMKCYNEENNYHDDFLLSDVNNLTDLYEYADLVVKVICSSDRYCYVNDSKVRVNVLEVIKGDVVNGDDLWIYEPSSVRADDGNITLYQGCCFMKEKQIYILFLKALQYQDAYAYCSAVYGKYALDQNEKFIPQKELDEGNIDYAQIENISMIFTDRNVLEKYKDIKEELFRIR